MKLFSGRINYPTFILGRIITWTLFILIIGILIIVYRITDENKLILIGLILSIPFGIADNSLLVRRAHDLGHSGAWAILGFKNPLWYIQVYKASLHYAIRTKQWDALFLLAPANTSGVINLAISGLFTFSTPSKNFGVRRTFTA